MMTLLEVNAMGKSEFVGCFGGIYEHSLWVAERVAEKRPFAAPEQLADRMREVVDSSDAPARLRLIRAHPDLAGRLAVAGGLTEASRREQSGAGLDRLSADEFSEFTAMNNAYRERFGFPFVICVRKTDKAGILAAFRRRLENTPDDELAAAISEIHQIAALRLADLAIS